MEICQQSHQHDAKSFKFSKEKKNKPRRKESLRVEHCLIKEELTNYQNLILINELKVTPRRCWKGGENNFNDGDYDDDNGFGGDEQGKDGLELE